MGFEYIDVYIAQFSVLIPLVLGILKKNYLTKPYRWILWSVALSTLMEIGTKTMAYYGPNYFLFHLDTLAQGITLIPFFYFSFQSQKVRKWLKASLILLFLVELFEIILITGIYQYNSITRSYLSVLMTVLSFQYLRNIGRNEVLVDVHKHPMFWFCLAILLYFFANVLTFISGNWLSQTSIGQFLLAHRIHLVILILMRILLAVGFWRIPKTRHLWS